jgi:hypothetical protein
MSDTIACSQCGFPNPATAHSCMSCQSPLSAEAAGTARSPGKSAGGLRELRPRRSAPAPVPTSIYEPSNQPRTPEEILERIRQVRGEDAMKSLEMMALPDLRAAVEAELGSGTGMPLPDAEETAAPLAWGTTVSAEPAESPGAQQWTSSQASPTAVVSPNYQAPGQQVGHSSYAASPAAGPAPRGSADRSDPWVVDHHELRALSSTDPWKAQYARLEAPGTRSSPRKKPEGAGFKPLDLVAAVGVVAVLFSITLPWIQSYGAAGEGSAISPTSLPVAVLLKGIASDYPFEWFTAAVAMVVIALASVIGLIFPRNQAAVTALSIAGLSAILLPAALLVKLALSGEAGLEGHTAYVAAPGLYVALGAALVLLAGAALRGGKARG